MAQLDLFSYSEQYILVSSTFGLFYISCKTLFITPFVAVMKIRELTFENISKGYNDEILTNTNELPSWTGKVSSGESSLLI
jgi:hypothetical protein